MAQHIRNLNIKTFRGIKNLELDNLSDINILVGANNCGKTSVLEATMMLSKPDDFYNVVSVARLREAYRIGFRMNSSFFDSFLNLFNKLNDELLISVSGKINNQNVSSIVKGRIEKVLIDLGEIMKQSPNFKKKNNDERIVENEENDERIVESEEIDNFSGEMQFISGENNLISDSNVIPISINKYERFMRMERKTPFINMNFISTIDHIVKNTFSEIIRKKEFKNDVIDVLKLFDKNIADLKIIQDEQGRVNQIIDNTLLNYMPLSTYGDGIKKVLALANGIAEAKNGVLLVDEIETSIHSSVLKSVFSWLISACKEFNVQLFLTTHSIETVDAMLNCNKSFINDDLIRVITLVKKENQTVARILTGEKALQVRDDYDMELR